MNNISLERQGFNAELFKFKSLIKKGSKVLDIGKSNIHDYSSVFEGYKYLTVDINEDKNPSIVLDVQAFAYVKHRAFVRCADAVICNGVTEQCSNPFDLVAGVRELLKPGGLALFGICLTGFPVYDNDITRFTPRGAVHLVSYSGLDVLDDINVINNNGLSYPATYGFIYARRPEL